MNRLLAAVVVSALSFSLGSKVSAQSQPPSSEGGRRILRKVSPQYPQVALKMRLAGTVKMTAVVAPDGTVKSVEPIGGNPILIQAAQNAISQWKYAPGTETHETVELHFTP